MEGNGIGLRGPVPFFVARGTDMIQNNEMEEKSMRNDARRIFEDLLAMDISPDFADRIAKKSGWNDATVRAVIFEYRCFLLLSAISEHPVTPPEAVDLVWHEHILHTRHYQEVLPRILGKPLHHDPGREGDREMHRRQYQRTWRLYRRIFGREPTDLVWPRPQARMRDVFRRREEDCPTEDLSAYWLIAMSDSPAYAASSTPSSSECARSWDAGSTDTGSTTTSSCGTSCGGGCGGD